MSGRSQNFNNLSSEQVLLINILNEMYNNNIRQINNHQDAIDGLNEANNNIRATLIQMLNVNGSRRTNTTPSSSYFREFTIPLNTLTNRSGSNSRFLENFFSPIEVYPTQSQIEAATRRVRYCDIVSPINRSCPISLENFEDNEMVSIIRQCNHIFRTEELHTWFRSNCRCPICRYDIRNYNTNEATSSFFQQEDVSGNFGTSRPSSNTLLERRITETPNERMISNVLQSFLNESSGQIATGNNLTDASGNIAETIGLFRSLFNNNY
jgi:hypothetical protein